MNLTDDLKTRRFWRHCIAKALACGGAFSALVQFFLIFSPKAADLIQGFWPMIGICIVCLAGGAILSWPRPLEEFYSTANTTIKIVKGDILNERGHLVIGVCDTFDTGPPPIISQNSLLGQTLTRLFNGDIQRLDLLISNALTGIPVTGTIAKPGKTDRYPLGTVAVVRHDPRLIFFTAYCEMNQRNEANATIDGVWKSLLSLWDSLSAFGNHGAISIPVVGGGQSRIAQILPAQDSIRLIILSYIFESRKRRISQELRIVVSPNEYDRLDRLELRSFLASLKAS